MRGPVAWAYWPRERLHEEAPAVGAGRIARVWPEPVAVEAGRVRKAARLALVAAAVARAAVAAQGSVPEVAVGEPRVSARVRVLALVAAALQPVAPEEAVAGGVCSAESAAPERPSSPLLAGEGGRLLEPAREVAVPRVGRARAAQLEAPGAGERIERVWPVAQAAVAAWARWREAAGAAEPRGAERRRVCPWNRETWRSR